MTDATAAERPIRAKGALRRLAERPLALFGLFLILLVVGGAVLAPLVAPFDPSEQHFDGLTIEGAPLPPGGAFLLGTDLLGRDLFSRILWGRAPRSSSGWPRTGLRL